MTFKLPNSNDSDVEATDRSLQFGPVGVVVLASNYSAEETSVLFTFELTGGRHWRSTLCVDGRR